MFIMKEKQTSNAFYKESVIATIGIFQVKTKISSF